MHSKPVNLLAIETATASCSVALQSGDRVFTDGEVGSNIHSTRLLDMVQHVLQESKLSAIDLDAVAVAHGPGSFTGLRIGIGAAQGIAYGAKCPMIGISSLAALVSACPEPGLIFSAIDARMGEIYWAAYQKGGKTNNPDSMQVIEQLTEVSLSNPIDLKEAVHKICDERDTKAQLVGNAWSEYAQDFEEDVLSHAVQLDSVVYPEAKHLLPFALEEFKQGRTIAPGSFVAQYVRNDVAKKASKKPPI